MTDTAYLALEDQFARIADVEQALGLLGWDRAVMMPVESRTHLISMSGLACSKESQNPMSLRHSLGVSILRRPSVVT